MNLDKIRLARLATDRLLVQLTADVEESMRGVRARQERRRELVELVHQDARDLAALSLPATCAAFVLWASAWAPAAQVNPAAVRQAMGAEIHAGYTPLGVGWDGVNSKQYRQTGRALGWQS